MRKLGTWLLMLAMMLNVFAGMALPANAAEDNDRTGSIYITIPAVFWNGTDRAEKYWRGITSMRPCTAFSIIPLSIP